MNDAEAFNRICQKIGLPQMAVTGGSMNHDLLILLDTIVERLLQLENALKK